MPVLPEPSEPTELKVRPGSQAGWTLPLMGEDRCKGFGHELGETIEYSNGLLVGYCSRCPARVEIPWFRGGTMVALARAMVVEALQMPRPALSVLEDLDHVEGLLRDDIAELKQVLGQVRQTHRLVELRRSLGQ